jgi:hypothetical protein
MPYTKYSNQNPGGLEDFSGNGSQTGRVTKDILKETIPLNEK